MERLCQGLGVILENFTKKLCRVAPVWSPPQDGAWGHVELPPRAHFGESCGWWRVNYAVLDYLDLR